VSAFFIRVEVFFNLKKQYPHLIKCLSQKGVIKYNWLQKRILEVSSLMSKNLQEIEIEKKQKEND